MTPDADAKDWLFNATHWWLGRLGGSVSFLAQMQLLTPTEDNFPVDMELRGDALAQDYFLFVMEHAGVTGGPFELVQHPSLDVAGLLAGMSHGMTSAPTGGVEPRTLKEGDPLVVPYTQEQLESPEELVSTMARGIAHYLSVDAPVRVQEPDETAAGMDPRELWVDLGAVILGFGVFLANSAFEIHKTEEGLMVGWGVSHRGALGQVELSYALAIMASLIQAPPRSVTRFLKPNPRGFFKSALKDIRKNRQQHLQRLRGVASNEGPYR